MPLKISFPPSLGELAATARADLLREWSEYRLGRDVVVEVARTYEAMRDDIRAGEVDLAWAPPQVCASVELDVAAIFKAVRRGYDSYCAAFIGRRRELARIEDVRGKRAVWVDPLAVAGHLLPMAHLRGLGLDPEVDLESQRFVGSYGAALRTVLDGDADFTAIYCGVPTGDAARLALRELVGKAADELALLGHTARAPSDGLVVTHRGASAIDLVDLAPLVDGSDGHTFFLSLLEADRLVRADPGDYAILRG